MTLNLSLVEVEFRLRSAAENICFLCFLQFMGLFGFLGSREAIFWTKKRLKKTVLVRLSKIKKILFLPSSIKLLFWTFWFPHVLEHLLFSIFPSILNFDLTYFQARFGLCGTLMGYSLGQWRVQKVFLGLLM